MEIKDLIEKLNTHSIEIYKAEIAQMVENNKTVNWLLGLASAGLLFSFNNYTSIIKANSNILIFQAIIFLLIILVGYLYRRNSNKFMEHTISIIRMFDFLRIEFDLEPDFIEKECETEKLDTIFSNYLNGEYFQNKDQTIFEGISDNQSKSSKLISTLTFLAIALMIIEFGCFFLLVL